MVARTLPRVLKFFDVSVLSSASMGPAYSLAATMGTMVAVSGGAAPMALLVLGAIMLCIAIGFAKLSRIAPNAGSSYSWMRRFLGPGIGAYGAWLLLLSNFFATMATAVPAGIYTLALLAPAHAQDPLWAAIAGGVWILGSSLLLYVGMRPTARVTLIALLLELLVLAASAVAAAFAHPHLRAVTQTPPALPPATLPLWFAGFAAAMTLGVWMSDGWEVSASTSEEMRDDAGASGRGGIVGLVVTIAILAACMFAYLHLGTVQGFAANQSDAMAYVAHLLGGAGWRIAIIGVVLISSLSSLWTTILYLSRSVYAMGRDGLLPRGLGRLDVRNEPLVALGVVAVLTTIAQLLTGLSASANAQLQFVLNASSVFLGLLFVGSALACVRRFAAERASRPLGVVVPALGGFALLGVIGVAIFSEDRLLQAYAVGGVLLGIPFALLRRGRGRGQARLPEQSAPAP